MRSKFWTAVLVALLIGLGLHSLIYNQLLAGAIEASPSVRMFMAGPWPKHVIAEIIFALCFVWVYARGLERGKPALGQGLRFGFIVGLLYHGSWVLIMATMVPTTETFVVGTIALGIAREMIMGMAVGITMGLPAEAGPA